MPKISIKAILKGAKLAALSFLEQCVVCVVGVTATAVAMLLLLFAALNRLIPVDDTDVTQGTRANFKWPKLFEAVRVKCDSTESHQCAVFLRRSQCFKLRQRQTELEVALTESKRANIEMEAEAALLKDTINDLQETLELVEAEAILAKNVANSKTVELEAAKEEHAAMLQSTVDEKDALTQGAFLCAITQDVLHDPVMCCDGHTYERRAIERWFEDHNTSPLTNDELENKDLIPNLKLQQAIRQHLDLV